MLLPERGSLVIAAEAFSLRAFKHCGIETFGVKTEDIHKEFPRPVDCFLLEVVAKRPVAEHLEHGVVICVEAHLLKVVVFSADTQTLLAVGDAGPLRGLVAEYDVLELVHAGVGEHKRGVILDHHRGRGDNLMAFALEELLERFAYLVGSLNVGIHLYIVVFVFVENSVQWGNYERKITNFSPN